MNFVQTGQFFVELYAFDPFVHKIGKIGRFSFAVLLMHLCSALGMLTIGTVVVDLFGILVLPEFSSKKFERLQLEYEHAASKESESKQRKKEKEEEKTNEKEKVDKDKEKKKKKEAAKEKEKKEGKKDK